MELCNLMQIPLSTLRDCRQTLGAYGKYYPTPIQLLT